MGCVRAFDIKQLRAVREICQIPLVASGGAGAIHHFREVFAQAEVDAALAASVFHSGEIGDFRTQTRAAQRRYPGEASGSGGAVTEALDARVSGNDGPIGFSDLDRLDFGKGGGLIPAVIQHAGTGAVLMIGYMNREALEATLTRGRVVFFSRSKGRLWEKGETSGHSLEVAEIHTDCDSDALLVSTWPRGPVCHSGSRELLWYGNEHDHGGTGLPEANSSTLLPNASPQRPEGSYTARLVAAGVKRIAQKVSEEGLEVALAAAGGGSDREVIAEACDLFYHVLVLLKVRGLSLKPVLDELRARHANSQ